MEKNNEWDNPGKCRHCTLNTVCEDFFHTVMELYETYSSWDNASEMDMTEICPYVSGSGELETKAVTCVYNAEKIQFYPKEGLNNHWKILSK